MNQFDPLDFGSTPAESPLLIPPASHRHRDHGIGLDRPLSRTGMSRARAKSAATKCFVLDTNVLLHDPACFQRFGDNHVCIPVDVLSELDRFKNEPSERGANARAVHRALTRRFENHDESITRGIPTEGGGTLRLLVFDLPDGQRAPSWILRFRRVFPDQQRVDHRILASTLMLQRQSDKPVILVSKDLNLQLKARAVGVPCEDYLNDKVEAAEVDSYDLRGVDVTPNELQRFASSGSLDLDPARTAGMLINEYVLLTCGEKKTMPARFTADRLFRRILVPKALAVPNGIAIRPVNLGQQCFVDALLDPDISLVTCYGHAGTGKTLLAVAAGLHAVFSNAFRGLTISRPVVAMGDTLGYLPGSLNEKMRPWLQPIYDALDFLLPPPGIDASRAAGARGSRSTRKRSHRQKAGDPAPLLPNGRPSKPYDSLIEKGLIEIEALCYIRGRSIPHRFFVLDEAQQLTPLEAKTVVTRMSKFSKIVLIGDPGQIDNPYVDSRSNGLVYTRDRLKDHNLSAHVSLNKGERSSLAELGATRM